jgi:hypothetical protein
MTESPAALYCSTCGHGSLRFGGPFHANVVSDYARKHPMDQGHDPRLITADEAKRILADRIYRRAKRGKDVPCLTS